MQAKRRRRSGFLYNAPVDFVATILAHGLTVMFIIGALGCTVVIPMVAYRLSRAWFYPDSDAENDAAPVP